MRELWCALLARYPGVMPCVSPVKYALLSLAVLSLLGCDTDPSPAAPEITLSSDYALTLGHYAPAGGEFSAIDSGEMIEIVQGIQGGIHTEIALQLDLGLSYAEESSIRFDLEATTTMEDGAVVASLKLDAFKATSVGLGRFRTPMMPLIFDENISDPYAGLGATITVRTRLGDAESGRHAEVLLVDVRNDLE